MVVLSRLHLLLLLLLLLFLALSARSVCGQNVAVSKVSTEFVEVAWNRTGVWYGVYDFTVTIDSTEAFCTEDWPCRFDPCEYRNDLTGECGSLEACTHYQLTVSGGSNTSVAVPFQTVPKPVTALDTRVINGALHITWTNPSGENSTCHNDTAVRLALGRPEVTSTTYHPVTEESVVVPLCLEKSGSVDVWTRGGGGDSSVKSASFDDDDGHGLVDITSCRAVGCYGVEVTWDYNSVCPNVSHFCVRVDGEEVNCTEDTTTTRVNVTGLEEHLHEDIFVYVYVYGKDGNVWERDYISCRTYDTAVTNLVVEGVGTTSINATWGPPMCVSGGDLVYRVALETTECDHTFPQDSTANATYLWKGLEEIKEHHVCVRAEYYKVTDVVAYTLPRHPTSLVLEMEGEDSVHVQWNKIEYEGHAVKYILSWGNDTKSTYFTEHTIEGYNSTEALGRVCVQSFMKLALEHSVTSLPRCSDYIPPAKPPVNGLLVTLYCIAAGLGFTFIVWAAMTAWKRHKKSKTRIPPVMPKYHFENTDINDL